MPVIWLVLDLNPKKRGSGERQLIALARAVRPTGIRLRYFFSAPAPRWFTDELAAENVRPEVLPLRDRVGAVRALARRLGQERPSLVHFHFFRPWSPLIVTTRLWGASIVLTDHVTPVRGRGPKQLAKRARGKLIAPLIDLRIAVSDFVAARVAEVDALDRRRIVVVENGVDLPRFERASGAGVRDELALGERRLVVCVARLVREKGVIEAVEAVRHLPPDTVLAFVGDGPLEAALMRRATALRIADRIRFLGLRQDVERLLAACDVSLVPSRWEEAFGQAVVESMAAGRATVVTDSGAMPGIVGDAGVVVPRGDARRMAAAVSRLLERPLERARLGELGRRRARRYSLESWVARTLAVYARFVPIQDLLAA